MDIEERIARLLDQLENPTLTETEISKIQQKIKILRQLAEGE